MSKFAIVIPAYNRPESLKRLFSYLNSAYYSISVDLIVSIDYSGSEDVLRVAENFEWHYGEKLIINHDKNIGLKANILSCGDMTEKYEAIILLEDDLIVSPAFFKYAIEAYEFYKSDENIAGISLYSYDICEVGLFRFFPYRDEYDTYFIQWPSSWGQLWTQDQWKRFRQWLSLDIDLKRLNIPDFVKTWTKSWKKYFVGYMVATNKFFVYPYVSFTNVIGAGGIHFAKGSSQYSVNLYQGNNCDYQFRPFSKEAKKYDSFFQFENQSIKIADNEYFVTFDLYGTKQSYNIKTDYVLTSTLPADQTTIIQSYGHELIPFEENILTNQTGNFFYLVHSTNKGSKFPIYKRFTLYLPCSTKDRIKNLLYIFTHRDNKH